jgi:hypothetical protein
MHRLGLLVIFAACGSSTKPKVLPQPVEVSEQELCERVAARVVDRFVAAAVVSGKREFPDTPALTAEQALAGDHRAMFVTVTFDSCFAEWSPAARTCFLDAAADAPIEQCKSALGDDKLAAAIRRTVTVLYTNLPPAGDLGRAIPP